jgi:hypothetical protein
MHYRIAQADLESVWTHWGVDPRRPEKPHAVEPRSAGERDGYDRIALAVAAC